MDQMELENPKIITRKLTTLWAFSEVAFGGLLHALKIPLTGLFVGGAAIIFISMIFYFSESKREIIKATFIVVIIKAMISPHVPIFAHLAVLIQGLLGYFILSKKHFNLGIYLLAFISMIFSAFQMVFTLTLVLGNTFWDSINLFGKYVLSLFQISSVFLDHYLFIIIIGIYFYLHILGAVVTGYIAVRIPDWITNNVNILDLPPIATQPSDALILNPSKKKSIVKSFKIFLFVFFVFMLLISYSNKEYFSDILIMFIRAILIIIIWYFFLSPNVYKLFNRLLNKQKNENSEEVKKVLEFLPEMKIIAQYSWKYSKEQKGLRKLKQFILNISYYLMIEQ